MSEKNATRKGVTKRGVFCGTEKAREQTEDMRLYIQTVLESRSFYTAGNWRLLTHYQPDAGRASH